MPGESDMENAVTQNPSKGCFEILCGASRAFLEYREEAGRILLLHTEVPQEMGGRGLGGKLVMSALEYARRNHLKVVARCEFAQNYINRRPAEHAH